MSNWSDAAAVLISVVSLVVAVYALKRTQQYERFEYKPRLELADFDFSLTAGVSFSAVIENTGIKPVDLRGVGIAHGSADDPKKRKIDVIAGAFYLGAGKSERVIYARSLAELERMREETATRECMFYLWITYLKAEGDLVEVYYDLGGYQEDGTKLIALHVGSALT